MPAHLSPLQRLLNRYQDKTQLHFRPAPGFYKAVGINQFRFALLVRGQKEPNATEIKQLLTYFNQFFPVASSELIDPLPQA